MKILITVILHLLYIIIPWQDMFELLPEQWRDSCSSWPGVILSFAPLHPWTSEGSGHVGGVQEVYWHGHVGHGQPNSPEDFVIIWRVEGMSICVYLQQPCRPPPQRIPTTCRWRWGVRSGPGRVSRSLYFWQQPGYCLMYNAISIDMPAYMLVPHNIQFQPFKIKDKKNCVDLLKML